MHAFFVLLPKSSFGPRSNLTLSLCFNWRW